MQVKRAISNVALIAIFLILLVSLIAIFNSQAGTNPQTASRGLQQSTPLPIITPPPSPTFNPTEIAEENLPAITPVVTPVQPEIEASSGGSNLRPLVTGEQVIFLGWSPDSSLALIQKKSQDYTLVQFEGGAGIHGTIGDLWVVDANGKTLTKVSDIAQAWAWSPDSQSVLFTEPTNLKGGLEGNLLAIDLKSEEIRSIAKIELVPGFNIQWLSTDRIFISQGSSLYRANLEGKGLSLVSESLLLTPLSAGTSGASTFRICPDESKVAYTVPSENGNELWIANINGLDAIKAADWVSYFEWKPDCTELVFSSIHKYQGTGYDSNIMIVGRDGKNLREIVPASQPDETNDFPRWTSSGDWIIYSKRVPLFDPNGRLEFQIWKVDPKGEKNSILVKHAGVYPELSADGHLLAFNAQTASVMDGTPNTMNAFVVEIDLGN